jgi:DNA-binding transcriptional regulator YhcF (GntR family)
VKRQATAQMIAGRLQPGERLPSVRQLARELGVSRTTAERIHEALGDAMLTEVRPRSGVFATSPDVADQTIGLRWAQNVYRFLEETATHGAALGLSPGRLASLLASLEHDPTSVESAEPVQLPILATRDAFECMTACLPADFPAALVHVSPRSQPYELAVRPRYLLCGYYLRERARLIAEPTGCSLLHVRYNVTLLDAAMTIPAGQRRHFVTRDRDNAETTAGMLASAYPEVPTANYRVAAVADWLEDSRAVDADEEIWVTITAAATLKGRVDAGRVHVMHPVLASDFVEELRCLALFLQSDAAHG